MISFDGGVNTDKGMLTGVTANDKGDGNNLGKYLVTYIKQNLKGKATILLETWMGLERIKARTDGVKEVLDASGLNLKIVQLDTKGERETAANVTANYSGDYDIIVASEMNTAWGAISTLRAQKNTRVKVFNVSGWGKEDFEAMRKGDVNYVTFISRTPVMMWQKSVQALVDHVSGKKLERYTYVLGQFVNKDNVNKFWDFSTDKPLQ
jgi:ABC-type sugar transport system substrate-binding protein